MESTIVGILNIINLCSEILLLELTILYLQAKYKNFRRGNCFEDQQNFLVIMDSIKKLSHLLPH